MRLVNIEELTPEMELARPVYKEGMIMLNTGKTKLNRFRERLKELGINYVYVNDELGENIVVNDIIRQETRQEGQQIIKKVFQDIKFNNQIEVKPIKELIDNIVDQLFYAEDILVNLVKINSFDSYTYSHSVNVAVLSLMLARSLNFNREELQKLGVGSILHDVGKVLIPEDIINKPGELSEEEFKIVQEHPVLGYEHIKDNYFISSTARSVVLSHHERIDSSGYPRGIDKNEMHEFPQLVGIIDVFDALTSNRVYRDKWPMNKAVNYLLVNAGKIFRRDYVNRFVRHIAVYPNGTEVVLSNGKKAIVKSQNENYPTRPVVKLRESKREVDLLNHLNIVIEKVL